MQTFVDLQDSILHQVGDVHGKTRLHVKRWLNDARNMLWEQIVGPYKETTEYLTTSVAYVSTTAITVAITNDSTTVTSDGATDTVFTSAMAGRFIKLGGTDPWYKIASITNGTELELADAFVGTTAAAAAFKINTYLFALPSDMQGLIQVFVEAAENWREIPVVDRNEVYAHAPVPLRWDASKVAVAWLEEKNSDGVYQLGLYPPPSSVSLVRFRYYKNPTEMSADSDEVGIPGGDAAILAYALYTAYNFRGKDMAAANCKRDYARERDQLKRTVSRAKRVSYRRTDHSDATRGAGVGVNLGPWYPR